ncbi:hypothetical protein HGRIS_012790 [Hohenbuehelia grisea]|uniref:Alpha N-terminal protein methyltransferase 1 n=1 Tax=Hohenbuehelia grisea TaxID=104357 RepID=A0ABR3ITK6_9AGAR
MAATPMAETPDTALGIEYWNSQPASIDGVLGGFGEGSLPRVDALGSRLFLLHLRPELCTVPSSLKSLSPLPGAAEKRFRALDVGAGVGRVTAEVLLPLVHDAVVVEPVTNFVNEALTRSTSWRGIPDATKSATIIQGTLQAFDPACPIRLPEATLLGRVGRSLPEDQWSLEDVSGFDIVWCQWCLGHLSDPDLVAFFKRAQAALRPGGRSLIIVKENLCSEPDAVARASYDPEDSSLTRSDALFKDLFKKAGLTLIREQIQEGFEAGLYPVKMHVLYNFSSCLNIDPRFTTGTHYNDNHIAERNGPGYPCTGGEKK